MKKVIFILLAVSLCASVVMADQGIRRKNSGGGGSAGPAGAAGAAGPAGPTVGATTYLTLSVGGEVVASSAVTPFFPGAIWYTGESSCTITSYRFNVWQPSQGSAVFPMFAVAQSSWQFSPYTAAGIATATVKSVMVTGVAIVVPSTSSFNVGIASAPIGAPASEFSMTIGKWCGPGSGYP